MKLSVKITGLQKRIKTLKKEFEQKREDLFDAVRWESKGLLIVSLKEVPVDTGALYDSHKIDEKITGNSIAVTVQYTVPYAKKVHDLPIPHIVGNYWFLRGPLERREAGYKNRIATFMRKAAKGRGGGEEASAAGPVE